MKTIFLTDQVYGHPNIVNVSKEIMFSVAGFYKNPKKATNYRKKTFTSLHRIGQDSGGFQFLMGKLTNPSPYRTIQIYKQVGIEKGDFPIQLDLPPRYGLDKEERMKLLVRSAEFFHIMADEIESTVGVVHGWELDELKLSLSMLDDTDVLSKVAAGTNLGVQKGVQHIISHVTSDKTYVSTPYFADKPATIITDHVTSNKSVAAGSYQNSGRNIVGKEIGPHKVTATPSAAAEQTIQKAPKIEVISRLALVLNLLRKKQLFILGAGSPHDMHMVFLGGATYGDTSSWRLKAYLGEIYVPGKGARAVGYKASVPRPDRVDKLILSGCLADNSHPLNGMNLNYFLELCHYNMADWRRTLAKKEWPLKPFDARALHNAWVIKHVEEAIANEYANDPLKYHRYLKKRFAGRPQLTKKFNALWSRLKKPYVQSKMTAFLKSPKP